MPPAFLFPISKTILSCVQSVPIKRPKLTAMMKQIMAREHACMLHSQTHMKTHVCMWVGISDKHIEFINIFGEKI